MQSGVAQSLWSSTLHPLAKYLYCPLLQTMLCNYNIIHYVYAACVTKDGSSPKSSCAVQADRTHSCIHFKAHNLEIPSSTPVNNRFSFFFLLNRDITHKFDSSQQPLTQQEGNRKWTGRGNKKRFISLRVFQPYRIANDNKQSKKNQHHIITFFLAPLTNINLKTAN